MEDLNQLKIVLVKKKRTSKWLAQQYPNGVQIQRNQIYKH